MKNIYFDNGATSFPKAPGVGETLKHYVEDIGGNVNRGVYQTALSAQERLLETREKLCRLFNFPKPDNVVFTMNITHSLNYLLKGFLKKGDHCLISSMEHNAVMRPLTQLERGGVSFTRIPCDTAGYLDVKKLELGVGENTKTIIMTHASNVCGTILPVEEVGRFCRERGLIFILDTAQTAGFLDIDMAAMNIDALAFTGHKSLLGPQGTGGFIISDKLARSIEPLISGGTGSLSDSEEIPPYLPDRFEPGTPNIPGIYGLHTALCYLEKTSLKAIREYTLSLTSLFLDEIRELQGISLIGLPGVTGRTALVSLDFPGRDNGEIAYRLDTNFGIMTRSGMHCAPSAHKTLGTFPRGTVRFSFSHFNTRDEITYAIDALKHILKDHRNK
jgi:cysteine desulfurase family protein